MASAITKTFFRCVKSANLQKAGNLTRRLEYNTANISRLAAMPNLSGTLYGGNPGRSIWYLAANNPRKFKSTDSWPTVSCACGSFHSKSDVEFSQLLSDELSGEKERLLEIPPASDGWSLKHDGSDCKMSKKIDSDSIEVSFNVNASVPPANEEDTEEEQEIIAQPDFTVEIKKSSSSDCVSFDCYFPEQELDEEEHVNTFSIRSVIMHKGDVNESTYVIDTDNIDPTLYKHMLTYLQARGVTNEFADDLITIATAVENQEYVKSLGQLHKFVSCK